MVAIICFLRSAARNNLAHGANYQDGGAGHADFAEGSEREDALLGQSLAVMTLALKARPDIHDFFSTTEEQL